MELIKHNVSEWIENHKIYFVPPVCNKCMFNDQLKAFLVSGPNMRKDFHLEEGEELFYMIKGDMCLRTVNQGLLKDIKIRAGEIYMQPGRILHSPQRSKDTIGLVVERSRSSHEMDCLRFFENERTLSVAFERWFHMTDAEADLPPIIFEYLENIGCRKPYVKSNLTSHPYKANMDVMIEKPLDLCGWIRAHSAAIRNTGYAQLFGPPKYKSKVNIYSCGTYCINAQDGEIFIWFLEGTGSIVLENKTNIWNAVEATKIPIGLQARLIIGESSYVMTVFMPTPETTLI